MLANGGHGDVDHYHDVCILVSLMRGFTRSFPLIISPTFPCCFCT